MLRESMQWQLLNAAMEGKRPSVMTPEEEQVYNSYAAGIRSDRADGRKVVYDIPSDLHDTGVDFDVKGFPEKTSRIILAVAEKVEAFYSAASFREEDGSMVFVPGEERDILVFNRYLDGKYQLPVTENTGIADYIRWIAYGYTADLIDNYENYIGAENCRALPKVEDLICRIMTIVIMKSFLSDWEVMISGIPGVCDSDRDALAALSEGTIAGKNLLRVREVEHKEYPWIEQIPVRNRIRAADSDLVRSRQKKAARIAAEYRQEDLEPLIRIRQYVTKNHRLLDSWLRRNYPDSPLIQRFAAKKVYSKSDRGYSGRV